MNIVVSTPDGAVSLLVDEIGDVLEVDASDYEQPPDNLDPAARELIRGVYKMKNGLLLVLDTERAIEIGGTHASLNSRLDAQSSEAGNDSAPFSPDSDVAGDEQARPTQSRNSNGKGTKRVVAKKADSTARSVKAGMA
jgi:hypothetical protein